MNRKKNKDGTLVPLKKDSPGEERTFEFKVEKLMNPDVSNALKKLGQYPMKPAAAMRVKRGSLIIYNAAKTYLKERDEIFTKWATNPETKEVEYEDEGKTRYKVPEKDQQACADELQTLLDKTIKVPVVYISQLQGVDVTPEFLSLLDGIVVDD